MPAMKWSRRKAPIRHCGRGAPCTPSPSGTRSMSCRKAKPCSISVRCRVQGTATLLTPLAVQIFARRLEPSYREIFDLSNWDKAVAINTPGQSGQPGSRHYSDLLSLWEAGQYFPLVYSK